MNKNALSPLQSTVILLIISIVIGIVVMSWGRSYVEQATAKADQKAMNEKTASMFEVMNEKLKSGEITQDQYNEMKDVLLKQKS